MRGTRDEIIRIWNEIEEGGGLRAEGRRMEGSGLRVEVQDDDS